MSDTPRTEELRSAFKTVNVLNVNEVFSYVAEILTSTDKFERENAALRAELEGVKKDAERYRWLREQNERGMVGKARVEIFIDECVVESGHSKTELDTAIDAAIAQGK